MGTNEHRAAISEMKKAVIADPNLTEAYLSLSRSHFAVGDYDMALYYRVMYAERQYLRQRVQSFIY
jgi:Tfp pilus assembly protein PilF